jgi:hypothetical protein
MVKDKNIQISYNGEIQTFFTFENDKIVDKPILFVTKDPCDCKCCDKCTKVYFTYIILNKDKATAWCITPKYFMVQFKNTLYFT